MVLCVVGGVVCRWLVLFVVAAGWHCRSSFAVAVCGCLLLMFVAGVCRCQLLSLFVLVVRCCCCSLFVVVAV